MTMFWAILYKEVREGAASPGFLLSLGMLMVMIPIAAFTQGSYYHQTFADRELRLNIRASDITTSATVVSRPVPLLLPFFNGIYASLPNEFVLQRDFAARGPSSEDIEPLNWVSSRVDLGVIIGLLLTLMAIINSHAIITREREQGTLKLVFSCPVSGKTMFIAKLIGLELQMTVLLLSSIILYIGVIMVSAKGTFGLSGHKLLEVAVLAIVAMLSLGVFVALGVIISTIARHSSIALAISAGAWVIMVLIWLPLAPYLAFSAKALPSRQMVQRNISLLESVLVQGETQEHKQAAVELQAKGASIEAAWVRYMDIRQRWITRRRNEVGRLIADQAKEVRGREDLARKLLMISPAGTYLDAIGIICDTGLDDYYRFIATVEQYDREVFLPASLEYQTRRGPQANKPRNIQPPEKLDIIPFKVTITTLSKRVSGIAPHLLLLMLENGALIGLGFWRFSKYDVR